MYEDEKEIYAIGKRLLAAVKVVDLPLSDELMWACEDLEESLLDLKVAVLNDDPLFLEQYAVEVQSLIAEIRRLMRGF